MLFIVATTSVLPVVCNIFFGRERRGEHCPDSTAQDHDKEAELALGGIDRDKAVLSPVELGALPRGKGENI